ncbi:hypothetical protein M514_08939 [Trichuris suis]|uniref:Uncharacterized protein n=1 Tax=Trichuris suis TaxID=68888 RepID=A0A085LYZ8_9BILA|nr:hypothetical protein M513_08939 [Trichuris suis]KFD70409.1 hypothetical protein M514_08939 [Trichuris suis]
MEIVSAAKYGQKKFRPYLENWKQLQINNDPSSCRLRRDNSQIAMHRLQANFHWLKLVVMQICNEDLPLITAGQFHSLPLRRLQQDATRDDELIATNNDVTSKAELIENGEQSLSAK